MRDGNTMPDGCATYVFSLSEGNEYVFIAQSLIGFAGYFTNQLKDVFFLAYIVGVT